MSIHDPAHAFVPYPASVVPHAPGGPLAGADATTFRTQFKAHLAALLGDDGVLLMPTMPDIAPLRSESEASLEDYRNRALRMLCIAGLGGLPQLSLPLAGRDGAPMGLSLVGPPGSDRNLVALAATLDASR